MPRIFVIASGQAGISAIKPFVLLLSANGLLINSRIVPILVDTWDSPLIREAESTLKLYSRVQKDLSNERQCFFGTEVLGYNQLIDPSAAEPEFKYILEAPSPSIGDRIAQSTEPVKRAWRSHIDPESDGFGAEGQGETKLTATALALLLNEPPAAQPSAKPSGKARSLKNEGSEMPQNFTKIGQHLWSDRGLEPGDRIVFVSSPAGGTGLSVTAEMLRRMQAGGIGTLGLQAALLWSFPRPNVPRHAELLDRARLILDYFKDARKEEMLPVQHLYLIHHPNTAFTTDLTALALLDFCTNEQDKKQGYGSDLSRKNWAALARLEAAVNGFEPWKGLRQKDDPFFEAFIAFGKKFEGYMQELRVHAQTEGFQFPISPVPNKLFTPKKAGKGKGERSPQDSLDEEMGKKTASASVSFLKGLTQLVQGHLPDEAVPNLVGEQEKGSSWEPTKKWPENLNHYTWLDLSRWVPSVRAKAWLSGHAVRKVAENPAGAAAPFQQMVSDILDLIDLERKNEVEAPAEGCFQGDDSPESNTARKVLGIPDGGDLKVMRWKPSDSAREQVLGFQHPDTLYVPAPELEKELRPLQHNLKVEDERLLFDRTTPPHISEELKSHIRKEVRKGKGQSLERLLDKKFQAQPEADPTSGEPPYHDPVPALFVYQSVPDHWENGQHDLWYLPYAAASYATAPSTATRAEARVEIGPKRPISIPLWTKALAGILAAAVVIWLVNGQPVWWNGSAVADKPGSSPNSGGHTAALRPTTETIGAITYALDTLAQPGAAASVYIAPNTQAIPSGSQEAKYARQINTLEGYLKECFSSPNPAAPPLVDIFDFLETCRINGKDIQPVVFRGAFLPTIAGRLIALKVTDTRYKYLKRQAKWVLTEITVDSVSLHPN